MFNVNWKIIAIVGGIALILLLLLKVACNRPTPVAYDSTAVMVHNTIKDSIAIHWKDSVRIKDSTAVHWVTVPKVNGRDISGNRIHPADSCSEWTLDQFFARSDTGWYHLIETVSCNPPEIDVY